MITKQKILNVSITSATKKEILEYIVKNVEFFKKKLYIVTPNPEFLVLASKNNTFKAILNRADLALADGVGVTAAARLLGKPLGERFTGVDLVKSLCKEVAEKPITVGFLGGRDGVAEKTVDCLRFQFPNLRVIFVGEEWPNGFTTGPVGLHPRPTSSFASLNSGARRGSPAPATRLNFLSESGLPRSSYLPYAIRHTSVDILFVAFGCPKQEFWINENLDKIPVKIAIGVGGAFDYISGKIPRAPKFLRDLGLEWLFRLAVQPWRIKRQLSLFEFTWLVFREKLGKN